MPATNAPNRIALWLDEVHNKGLLPEDVDLTDDVERAENLAHLQMQSDTSVSDISKMKVILREFLAQRPKPFDFVPQQPADDVQLFFDSMAMTVRKFTPLSIAKIKLQIAQIVGAAEIAWAANAERVQAVARSNGKPPKRIRDVEESVPAEQPTSVQPIKIR